MQGGKAAAATILEMRATGDFSKQSTKEYQRRWMEAYGHDFNMVRPLPTLEACCLHNLHMVFPPLFSFCLGQVKNECEKSQALKRAGHPRSVPSPPR